MDAMVLYYQQKCALLYLVHDGILGIFDLDYSGLHKVALLVVTVAPGDDGQVGGGPGVVQPLLNASKGLPAPGNNTISAGLLYIAFTVTKQAETM